MNSFIFSLFLSYSFLLQFLSSKETLDFIIGKLKFPIEDPPYTSITSFEIKGKTTYKSLVVIHAVSIPFSVDGNSLSISIGQPQIISPPVLTSITEINEQKFSKTIVCQKCALSTMNILYICDSEHPSPKENPEYCVQTNITIPEKDMLSFIVSSNLDSNSGSFVLDRIKEDSSAVFFMMLGNLYKSPKNSDNKEDYLKKYQKYIFDNSKLSDLLRSKPFVYSFNDLDFAGKDSDANGKGVKAINEAYRETFPNYIEDGQDEGIYQSFTLNKVKFIMTDSRSFLDKKNKQFFGSKQREWLKTEFSSALDEDDKKAIIITVTQPWNYVEDEYDIDIIKQDFISLTKEMENDKKVFFEVLQEYQSSNNHPFNFYYPIRARLSDGAEKFKSILLIVGERHLAFDTGRWNNYGSFPIAVAGPLDSWQECRGGPYSHGSFHDSKHQYLSVIAKGGCLVLRGIIANNKENVGDQIVFAYKTCTPDDYPGRVNRKCPMVWKEKLIHAFILIFAGIVVAFVFFFAFYWVGMSSFKLHYEKLKTQ